MREWVADEPPCLPFHEHHEWYHELAGWAQCVLCLCEKRIGDSGCYIYREAKRVYDEEDDSS